MDLFWDSLAAIKTSGWIKVRNIKREESLEDTVQTALTQIKEKCYDAELYDRGLKKEEIHHYGFAFEGKKVLIG